MISPHLEANFYVYMLVELFTNSILEVLELHAVGDRSIHALTKVAAVLERLGHAIVRAASHKPVFIGK